MKLYTFTGETPAEALKKAQIECGEEALVVNTKEVKKKGLGGPAIYEVVVAVEEEEKKAAPSWNEAREETPDDVLLHLSEAAKQISQIARVTEEKPFPRSGKSEPQTAPTGSSPAAAKAASAKNLPELSDIQKEIARVTDRIKLVQNMLWDKTADNRSGLVIPSEFAEIYRIAKNSGMAKEHLETIMKITLEHMPLSMRQNSETIRRYFNVLLRKMVPVRMETRLTRPNKKIMMLVGPTGVGKTTTLAKLAARFAFKTQDKHKVGIVTLDTYRIGAVEQLMYYAKMMRLGIETVQDPLDFSSALHSLKHCDYILIDTAGSSQHDKEKIFKLKQFLDAEKQMSVDVTLAVAANTKLEDLREIYRSYSELEIDSIIATKFDETSGFGNLFSLVYEMKKPLSYFSVGQEVPDDLAVATGEYFIQCLLDGFRGEGQ